MGKKEFYKECEERDYFKCFFFFPRNAMEDFGFFQGQL